MPNKRHETNEFNPGSLSLLPPGTPPTSSGGAFVVGRCFRRLAGPTPRPTTNAPPDAPPDDARPARRRVGGGRGGSNQREPGLNSLVSCLLLGICMKTCC